MAKKISMNLSYRILKKLLIGVSLFFCGIAAYYGLFSILKFYFSPAWISSAAFLFFLMTLIGTLLYRPLDLLWTEIFRRYFFKKRSYVHMMLMNLAEELETVVEIQELSNLI